MNTFSKTWIDENLNEIKKNVKKDQENCNFIAINTENFENFVLLETDECNKFQKENFNKKNLNYYDNYFSPFESQQQKIEEEFVGEYYFSYDKLIGQGFFFLNKINLNFNLISKKETINAKKN